MKLQLADSWISKSLWKQWKLAGLPPTFPCAYEAEKLAHHSLLYPNCLKVIV